MKPIPEMTRDELAQYAWQLKRMIRNLGKLHQGGADAEFDRAGGGANCPDCGLEYFDHPEVSDDLLTLACNGRLLKL